MAAELLLQKEAPTPDLSWGEAKRNPARGAVYASRVSGEVGRLTDVIRPYLVASYYQGLNLQGFPLPIYLEKTL